MAHLPYETPSAIVRLFSRLARGTHFVKKAQLEKNCAFLSLMDIAGLISAEKESFRARAQHPIATLPFVLTRGQSRNEELSRIYASPNTIRMPPEEADAHQAFFQQLKIVDSL